MKALPPPGETFTTWSGVHRASAAEVLAPESEPAVIEAVKTAAAAGRRLKVVGAGHSFSAIAVPEHGQMSLDRMGRVLAIDGNRVTVEAGIRLHALCAELHQRGLALPILGSIAQQSLAGATGTGTHGSSLKHGNLGSLLQSMRLVTGKGEIVELKGTDLDAARTHLGALGIVTQLSFDAVPAFRLEEKLERIPWDEALASMDRLAGEHEFIKLWWLPHTDFVAAFSYRRTEAPANASPARRWFDEHIVNRYLFASLLALGGAWPSAVPALNGIVAGAYFRPHRLIDRSDQILTVPMPPVHREAEWSFPVAQAAEGLRRVRAVIQKEALVVDFVVEVRFVRGDSGWMSPAYGGDACQLGVYAAHGAEAYFSAVAPALRELGGRPHWGKEAELTADDVLRLWPRALEFRARMDAWDPGGVFRNRFLDQLFPR